MFKDQSDFFKYFFLIADFFMAMLSGAVSFVLRFFVFDPHGMAYAAIDKPAYLMFFFLLSCMQVVAFVCIDLYSPRRIVGMAEEFFSILVGVSLNLIMSLALVFFLNISSISRVMVTYFAISNVVLTSLMHAGVRGILRKMRSSGRNLRTVLILGTEYAGRKVFRLIEKNPMYGFDFKGFVTERPSAPIPENANIIGDIGNLEEILDTVRPNLVIMALEDAHAKTAEKVLQLCDRFGCDLKIVPAYTNIVTASGHVESMDGLPIISIREVPAREGLNRVAKRLFDIFFSLVFILVFSELFIVIALIIKLSSKGPVFFSQDRIGLDGKTFKMLKFRSMYVQERGASDTVWTTEHDPRVTPVGRFIRRTSLDEIPQFFNVFVGQMSVVGPRPERPYYVEQFKDQYNQYMRRHAVKAGVTGWAQINGLRGDTSIQERIEADIFYIENWSFFLDLKIVVMTPFKGIFSRHAY